VDCFEKFGMFVLVLAYTRDWLDKVWH